VLFTSPIEFMKPSILKFKPIADSISSIPSTITTKEPELSAISKLRSPIELAASPFSLRYSLYRSVIELIGNPEYLFSISDLVIRSRYSSFSERRAK